LVYSGKAKDIIQQDISLQERKQALERLIEFSLRLKDKIDVLTVDNPCDGIYLTQRFKKEGIGDFCPGCSAGTRMFNIDEEGSVHPCQFWQDYALGNIRAEKFSNIIKKRDDLLFKLRQKQDFLKGKCGRCGYKSICGGCRVRAKAVSGDIWQEDPDCFLSEEELAGNGGISTLSAAQVA
jgi:radical SAM protein with 4Fe4S-binding SPASM domain